MKGQKVIAGNSASSSAGKRVDPPISTDENKLCPRSYQLEILERAKVANTIAYLDTGAGKTLIAVMLVKSYAHMLRKPKQNIAVVLEPKVFLVKQQADYFQMHTDLKIGRFFGDMGVDFWDGAKWKEQLASYEVFVMTPQIFLDNLRHSHFKLEAVKLIIFDECHHAQKDHPYARIMKEFYHRFAKANANDLPRVFGMTASPINTKGSNSHATCASEIKELERIMYSKVYALEDTSELEANLVYPVLKEIYYDDAITTYDLRCLERKLQNIKDKHTGNLKTYFGKLSEEDLKKEQKYICQHHLAFTYCLDNMGIWFVVKASEILLSKEEDNNTLCLARQYVEKTRKSFLRDVQREFALYLPSDKLWRCGANIDHDKNAGYVSSKIHCLIQALTSYSHVQQLRCIIFVERVITAMVLADFLAQMDCFSFLHFKYLAGSASRKNSQTHHQQEQVIQEFREGMVTGIVATNVLEEGLDVPGCNLIIRFDIPVTLRNHIQSRGRGRMQGSEYLILIRRGDEMQKRQLEELIAGEEIMRDCALNEDIISPNSDREDLQQEEMYCVESTGAIVTLNSSLQLIYYYCSQLPKDRYYNPRPYFHINKEDRVCILELPRNSAISPVEAHGNVSLLKKLVCLKACKELHAAGALTDNLLPVEDEEQVDEEDQHEIEESEAKYPLYLPSELVGDWISTGRVTFHCYLISFEGNFGLYPTPRNVVLLVNHAIPPIVVDMRKCLEMDTGPVTAQTRSIGIFKLDNNQVETARKFQAIIFSILRDRNLEKIGDLFDLDHAVSKSNSHIMYLLLPMETSGVPKSLNSTMIDWACITTVVSQFFSPSDQPEKHSTCCNMNKNSRGIQRTPDGLFPLSLLQNSIVITTHKRELYCISHVSKDLNSRSPFPKKEFSTYANYFKTKYDIDLQHKQQQLLCGRHLFGIQNLLLKQVQKEKGSTRTSNVELPAELCEIILFGIPMDILFMFSLMPSFMHRLEGMLAAAQFQEGLPNNLLSKSNIHTMKVLEALTRKSCQESFSLETLETLGDSFLKYVASKHLFLTYPHYHEGQLTSKRKKIISNHALYKLGCDHQIPGYIRNEAFDKKKWVIPGQSNNVFQFENSNSTSLSTDTVFIREFREMKMKAISDVVEAFIGMHLEVGGEVEAMNFMRWINIGVDFTHGISTSNRYDEVQQDIVNVPLLEKILNYKFQKPLLLVEAMTHASYQEPCIFSCYQRLEFLGDAVLDYVITSYLYNTHRGLSPGALSDMRSAQVNYECYAQAAVKWNLQTQLLHASPPLHQHITEFVENLKKSSSSQKGFFGWTVTELNVPKVLGDLVESIAGAILVDCGFNTDIVWEKMKPLLEPIITPETLRYHPVREFHELCQKLSCEPKYTDTQSEGRFLCKIEAQLKNNYYTATGNGPNKSTAKRRAAAKILERYNASC